MKLIATNNNNNRKTKLERKKEKDYLEKHQDEKLYYSFKKYQNTVFDLF